MFKWHPLSILVLVCSLLLTKFGYAQPTDESLVGKDAYPATLVHSIGEVNETSWIERFLERFERGELPLEWFRLSREGIWVRPAVKYIGSRAEPIRASVDEINADFLKQHAFVAFIESENDLPKRDNLRLGINIQEGARWLTWWERRVGAWQVWKSKSENMERANFFSPEAIKLLIQDSYPHHSAFYEDYRIVGVEMLGISIYPVIVNPKLIKDVVLFVPAHLSPSGVEKYIRLRSPKVVGPCSGFWE